MYHRSGEKRLDPTTLPSVGNSSGCLRPTFQSNWSLRATGRRAPQAPPAGAAWPPTPAASPHGIFRDSGLEAVSGWSPKKTPCRFLRGTQNILLSKEVWKKPKHIVIKGFLRNPKHLVVEEPCFWGEPLCWMVS